MNVVSKSWQKLCERLVYLFGRPSWGRPGWVGDLNRFRQQKARRFYLCLATVVIVPLLVVAAVFIYKQLPKPLLTTVSIDAPGITPPSEPLTPGTVTVHFSLNNPFAMPQQSNAAARLDLIGKVVKSGISMSPATPGEWRWLDDNTLQFTPQKDWPAGQQYTLTFDKSILAPHVRLDQRSYSFTTPTFSASLAKLAFYQDPVNPKVHEVVATVDFSHPVDTASFERHISLSMRPSGATIDLLPRAYKFTVNYDKLKREAYVTSEPITLPDQENYMTLTVDKGVQAAYGSSSTDTPISQQVLIPDVRSFFRVDTLAANIVRDEQDVPQQTLVINFTDGVKAEDLAKSVHAYLLPVRDEPWNPREITDDVLTKSRILTLVPVPTEHDYSTLQSFRFDAPEQRQLYVRMDAGLESQGEYIMSHFYDAVVSVPDYPKEARILSQGAVLSLSGSHKLSFLTRGVPALRVRIGQLLPEQIAHLVSQTNGNFSDPYFQNYNFGQNDITVRYTRIITLNSKTPKQAVYAALDLSNYLPHDAASRGMFFIHVQGWNPDLKRPIAGASDERFILVTDLGLVVKDNIDQSHDVFVQSIANGGPVGGVQVSLLGLNGLPVLTGTTDTSGHLHLPATTGLHDEKTPTVYLAHLGNDYSFIPFNRSDRQINLSNFDIGGVYVNPLDSSDALHAYVFSDRGIYRPGDSAHLGVIVKRRDWGAVAGVPVAVEITNPGSITVLKKKLALPADGFFDLGYAPDAAAPTGDYHASVYLLGDKDEYKRLLGTVNFQVEEFQPDSMRIHSHISGEQAAGWVLPANLTADVHLENLFGTPAQGRHVEAAYTLVPSSFNFDAYPDFIFDDPFLNPESLPKTVTETLPATDTDSGGNVQFKLDLSQYNRGLYRLIFSAQGFEAGGGRSVSAASSVRVSPLAYLVGHKADGPLDWIDKDSARSVRFLAVNPALKSITLGKLTLRLSEERYISTLVQQKDGTYQYQSVKKVTLLKSTPYALPAGGGDYHLATGSAGNFILELVDTDGNKLASLRYTVAGNRNATAVLEKNAELKVAMKGNDFRPGDNIELQITAPYTGAGLITIERDKVYAWQWFKTDTNVSVQHVHVPQGLEGNAYVNVTFVRALNSKEIFTSPLSYAVLPFSINRGARSLNITLNTPQKIEPGKPLTVNYRTSAPGRIVLFAVDEGILQVAHYRTPAPLDDFFRKRALQVTTSQIADQILPEYDILRQLSAIGGDEAAKRALGRNLNPFRRRTEKPVAYWSGIITSDGKPGQYTFKIPDYFNGSVQVMAVAVNETAMGSTETHTLVRGPFVILPNVLTSAAPGDQFTVGVVVANNLEHAAKDTVMTLEAQPSAELTLIGSASQKLTIAPGSEGRASFRFKANDRLGPASITFLARGGGREVRLTSTLSVRPAVPYSTDVWLGDSTKGGASVPLPRHLYPEFASQEALASSSPMILIRGLERYLAGYPYGCSEQIVSKVFPFLGFANDPVYQADLKHMPDDYAALIAKLRARQQTDGGFGYWPGDTSSAPFVSAYVLHFLTDAKELGYAVPPDMLDAGLRYLQQQVENDPDSLDAARQQAYDVYLLTRNGMVTTNYLTHIQEYLETNDAQQWHKDLVAVYLAASYKLLQQDDLANRLIAGYSPEQDNGAYYNWYDTALSRNALYLYLLARHFPERLKNLPDNVLGGVLAPVFAGDYNTLSSAYAVLALGAYSKSVAALEQGHIEISIRDTKGASRSLVTADNALARADLPLTATRVDLVSRGIGRLFYSVSQAGFDTALPAQAQSQGLEVTREYLDDQGNNINSAPLGSDVTVRVRIRTTNGRYLDNVVIVALLPGGFEVQRDSLRNSDGNWSLAYADIREDRVVLYGSFGPEMREITYKVKVTSPGSFIVPAIYANAMYDHRVFANSATGKFEVSGFK